MISKSKSKKLNIAYIGGGSRGWAWGLMSDLALEESLSGTVKLYDINYDAAVQNQVIGNRLYDREDVVGKWKYQAVSTMEEALTGADFVIISILPGTFEEMRSDVHEPERYGIYQSVGDTVGPGGLVRALRTIPIFVEIAKAIKEYAENAWIINYTNPMTLCVRTLYEIFPGIKAIGCCHEVFGTQKLLASMLEDLKGIEGVHHKDIRVNVLGINHFTWIEKASYEDIDLWPLYKEFVNNYGEEGFEGNEKGHWMNNHFASANRVKFDLFKKFGLIAAAGDRHLAEFMPKSWYLKNLEKVKEWKFGLTSVEWRLNHRQELIEKGKRLAEGNDDFIIQETDEEGVDLIKALLGMGDLVTNVNLPNKGQIQRLPYNSIVETNARLTFNSIQPICAGQLPSPVNNLVLRHINNQETILQAALTKDINLAFQAFIQDPLVDLDPEQAKELFGIMLRNTQSYLKGWDLEQRTV